MRATLFSIFGGLILAVLWLFVGCAFHATQRDAQEVALLTAWTMAERELEEVRLDMAELETLSKVLRKAIEVVQDERHATFSEIMLLSRLSKDRFRDAYDLATLMDLFFTVDLKEGYRETLKEILISLQRVVDLKQ